MSIASEIQRIKANIANAYTTISNKGGTLPATQNSANLPQTIANIPIESSDYLKLTETDQGGNEYFCYLYKPAYSAEALAEAEAIINGDGLLIQVLGYLAVPDPNNLANLPYLFEMIGIERVEKLFRLSRLVDTYTIAASSVQHGISIVGLSSNSAGENGFLIQNVRFTAIVTIEENAQTGEKSVNIGETHQFISPEGTTQITENGTYDVSQYASAEVNVVNQDYEDALVAFGVTEDLADSIEALTTYSNELTGEGDTTLSDAVRTLADGYDGGSSPVYEAISTTGAFYTDKVAPLKRLLVSFEPIQSGSGTPSPTNVRPISGNTECVTEVLGQNLYSRENGEYNAPVYAADGTSASYADVNAVWLKVKPNTTYYISFVQPERKFYFRWINCDENKEFISRPGGTYNSTNIPSSITTTATTEWVEIAVNQYDTGRISQNNWEICISETATTYEPYQSTTYTTALGRTVYGGTLDVVSGELTVDRAMVDLGTLSWGKASGGASNVRFYSLLLQSVIKKTPDNNTAGNIVCSNYENTNANKGYSGKVYPAITEDRDGTISVYDEEYASATTSEFKTAMSGVQLCYELATPQTYQLTPQQIDTLKGNNTVTVEGGDLVELVYLTHVLPTEYQAVSYIENTGNSYIDTGYSMTSDVTEQSIQFFSRPSAASSPFGAERSGAYSGVMWTSTGGAISSSLFIGNTRNAISETLQLGIWHTVTIKTTSDTSGSFIVDGYERAFTYSGGVLKGYPIWLFNNNNAATAQYARNRIARFQITDNGAKVRDLVACYRKSDDKPGMYDLINNVFYINAGTGEFTVGEDI